MCNVVIFLCIFTSIAVALASLTVLYTTVMAIQWKSKEEHREFLRVAHETEREIYSYQTRVRIISGFYKEATGTISGLRRDSIEQYLEITLDTGKVLWQEGKYLEIIEEVDSLPLVQTPELCMNVYVLESDKKNSDTVVLHGIFSTEEKAREAQEFLRSLGDRPIECYIRSHFYLDILDPGSVSS